ncbi:hypothetical protein [Iamia sp.]|uniref:hypothetical protein n=1 Tax=Iamia sp. TaxID=2722710 RepID=UPI002B7F0CDB|nr:hypothetical protein [Iamia sp.]HXH59079.1 hypothetical protein [Iamia sp.]
MSASQDAISFGAPSASDEAVSDRESKDSVLLELLAEGHSHKDAARVAGVSERTVRRRLTDRVFATRLHAARRVRLDEVNARVPDLVSEALDTTRELLATAANESVRLGAARVLLAQGARLEADELADRINRLEEAVLEQQGWTVLRLGPEDFDDDDA